MDSDSITKPLPVATLLISTRWIIHNFSFFQHWDMERRWTSQSALHFSGQLGTYLQSDRGMLILQGPLLPSPARETQPRPYQSERSASELNEKKLTLDRINSGGERMDITAVNFQFQIWSCLNFVHKYHFYLLIGISSFSVSSWKILNSKFPVSLTSLL